MLHSAGTSYLSLPPVRLSSICSIITMSQAFMVVWNTLQEDVATCQPLSVDLHTLSTSSVRWQMSRLVSDYVLHHWSSAAPDCLPSATELFWSPLLVSGTVCLNMSLPHLQWLSSGPVSRHLFDILYPDPMWLYSACAVTLVAFGHYNRPCYLLYWVNLDCIVCVCVSEVVCITQGCVAISTLHSSSDVFCPSQMEISWSEGSRQDRSAMLMLLFVTV